MLFRDWWRIPTPYGYVELELDEPGSAPTDELDLNETANLLDVLTYGIENRDPRITSAIVEVYAQANPDSFPPGLALSSLSVRDIDSLRPSLIRYLEHQVAAGTIRLYEDEVVIAQTDVLKPITHAPQPVVPEPSHTRAEELQEDDFIEIELVGEDDEPIGGIAYLLKLPDGGERSGTLDNRGFARIDHIVSGSCQVTFPELDAEAWYPL